MVAKYAHKVIIMCEPGRICHYGTPEEVITKENVERVYGITCNVLNIDGHLHVILGSPMAGDEDLSSKNLTLDSSFLSRYYVFSFI